MAARKPLASARVRSGHSPPDSSNARRCSPSQSISLPPQKRQKVAPDLTSGPGQPEGRRVRVLRQTSSGESVSDLSGSKWFEKSKNNVSQSLKDAANYNTEPPFFMSHQPNYVPISQTSNGSERAFGEHARNDSENDELRGVIDDLTIENKRLKQILRSQKSARSSTTSDDDKLFEVRMHGLPPERKRELELLLKNFASSVQSNMGSVESRSATRASSNLDTGSMPSSIQAPNSKTKHLPTDSGYGSNSGQTSVTPLNDGTTSLPVSQFSRNSNIKTYLHDIPDALLPRAPIVLSERAKMALVVRRLEQLFTGRIAVPGEHKQPLQQEEISQSAAKADRQENLQNNKRLRAEGSREAHILPRDALNLGPDRLHSSPKKTSPTKGKFEDSDQSTPEDNEHDLSRSMSPDQRPTRPLDLDIERQVNALENIEYIRHLGLSSPHINHADKIDGSWMYLNLLVSMAQLHTINVTPDFIRKAIRTRSRKFELSKDGHKVRWMGGPDSTVFSKEEERVLELATSTTAQTSEDVLMGGGSNKRSKTTSSSNAGPSLTPSEVPSTGEQTSSISKQLGLTNSSSGLPTAITSAISKPASPFDYKPIVFTGKRSASADDSGVDSQSSYDENYGLDTGSLVKALSKSNLNRHHTDEGLITFYTNNQFFCSDFSGDHGPVAKAGVCHHRDGILGVSDSTESQESPLRYHDACYFTPQFAKKGFHVTEEEIPSFSPTPISTAGQDETLPIDFPVSGLGGVTPEDNFALDVNIERTSAPTSATSHRKSHVTGTMVKPSYRYRVVRAQKIDLRPSQLPSPSYLFFNSSSSSGAPDMMDMFDDSEGGSSVDDDDSGQPSFPKHLSSAEISPECGTDDESVDDGSDDDSVDMLEAARTVNPDVVAAQEREYLINRPGGPTGIPGSLAVTVGTASETSSERELCSDVSEDDSDDDME